MKKLIAALSLLSVLSLSACGSSDTALQQENESLVSRYRRWRPSGTSLPRKTRT